MQRLKFDCSCRIDEGHSRIELSREHLTVWNSGGDRRTNCRWAWHQSSSFSVLISGLTCSWLPYSRESSRVEARVDCVSSWIALFVRSIAFEQSLIGFVSREWWRERRRESLIVFLDALSLRSRVSFGFSLFKARGISLSEVNCDRVKLRSPAAVVCACVRSEFRRIQRMGHKCSGTAKYSRLPCN